MSSEKMYNWGIIGCGKISSDFTKALLKSPRSNVVACGARKLEKARNFAKEFDIPIYNAYASYDAVAKDPNVDIVYIGTIHPSHYKAVVAACNNGKAVLCEKPVSINTKEAEEMVQVARANNVFFMEAMWTRFFPAYRKVRELIASGVIGDVVHYYGDFGVQMPSAREFPRLWQNNLGGGAILDLGCYPINPLSWIFGAVMPSKISAAGVVDRTYNVDTTVGATLIYNDKQYAQISCNFYTNSFQERLISGTKGRIRIESPSHAPTKITLYIDGGLLDEGSVGECRTFDFNLKHSPYETIFVRSEGMIYQIEEVIKCLDEGRKESPNYTLKEMLITMKIMDEIRKQVGIQYSQDQDLKSKL